MPPKTKTAFQLDNPYAEPAWPRISCQDQDTIIELLVNLLLPIGIHRKTFTKPSQGKRKRSKSFKKGHEGDEQKPVTTPDSPTISSQVLVGLNSVTRHLSSSSAVSCPRTFQECAPQGSATQEEKEKPKINTATDKDVPLGGHDEEKKEHAPANHMTILFTTRPPTPPLSSHLPMLAHTASSAHAEKPAIRLVVLPSKAEAKICEALGIARAGFIGLLEADEGGIPPPGMNALVEFVREKTPSIDPGKWLEDGIKEYRETRINAVQVPVPVLQHQKPKKETTK